MAVTSKWRQHIEAWQSSGLSQAEYCAQQQINVFTHAQGHRLELPASVSASWVAELLRCLA